MKLKLFYYHHFQNMKKVFLSFFLIQASCMIYGQDNTDRIKTVDIAEIVITKNKTSPSEKKLTVKWLLKENDELVTFIQNSQFEDNHIREISFRLANLSDENNRIIFKIYSQKEHLPFEEIYSHEINLRPKEEANKITFISRNKILKREGVFIGFRYLKRKENKGIYVFSETKNKPETFIKKGSNWTKFSEEKSFSEERFRQVDLYLKVK